MRGKERGEITAVPAPFSFSTFPSIPSIVTHFLIPHRSFTSLNSIYLSSTARFRSLLYSSPPVVLIPESMSFPRHFRRHFVHHLFPSPSLPQAIQPSTFGALPSSIRCPHNCSPQPPSTFRCSSSLPLAPFSFYFRLRPQSLRRNLWPLGQGKVPPHFRLSL